MYTIFDWCGSTIYPWDVIKRRQGLKADDHAISCSSHIHRVHCWSKPQP